MLFDKSGVIGIGLSDSFGSVSGAPGSSDAVAPAADPAVVAAGAAVVEDDDDADAESVDGAFGGGGVLPPHAIARKTGAKARERGFILER